MSEQFDVCKSMSSATLGATSQTEMLLMVFSDKPGCKECHDFVYHALRRILILFTVYDGLASIIGSTVKNVHCQYAFGIVILWLIT